MLHETFGSIKSLVHYPKTVPTSVGRKFSLLTRASSFPSLESNANSNCSKMDGQFPNNQAARGARQNNWSIRNFGYRREDFLRPSFQRQPFPLSSPSNFYQLNHQFQGRATSSHYQFAGYPTSLSDIQGGTCHYPNVVSSRGYRQQSPNAVQPAMTSPRQELNSEAQHVQWSETKATRQLQRYSEGMSTLIFVQLNCSNLQFVNI